VACFPARGVQKPPITPARIQCGDRTLAILARRVERPHHPRRPGARHVLGLAAQDAPMWYAVDLDGRLINDEPRQRF
jgi:hypothetical protein